MLCRMQIRVLGCSGGVGPGLRTTSLLVDEHVLVDAGTGVGDLSLGRMRGIDQVFLTHAHLDHVCGLAFLADNLFDQVAHPIQVHAHADTLLALRRHLFNWQLWPDFTALPSPQAPLLRLAPIAPGECRALGQGVTLTALPAFHAVPALGYALQAEGGVFAFTGDTTAHDDLIEALNALPRLDALMVDVAFPDEQAALGEVARHFTPQLAAQSLRRLRHRPQLLLTHPKPGCEARLQAQCSAALGDWPHRHLQRGDVIEF